MKSGAWVGEEAFASLFEEETASTRQSPEAPDSECPMRYHKIAAIAKSSTFLRRAVFTFLLLTVPASRSANPSCIMKMKMEQHMKKNPSMSFRWACASARSWDMSDWRDSRAAAAMVARHTYWSEDSDIEIRSSKSGRGSIHLCTVQQRWITDADGMGDFKVSKG